MRHTRRQCLAVGVVMTGALALGVAGSQAEEEDIQSRGFKLPSVSVPPPPSPQPAPAMYGLTIRPVGDGSGKVPLPPAAACPPTCSAQYPRGTPVVLAPVPAPGSTFAGWAGDCGGMTPCTLRMDRPMTVEARFTKLPPPASTNPSSSPVVPLVTPAAPAAVPIPYPVVPSQLGPELSTISAMMANGKPANAILDTWKGYVTRQVQAKRPFDVPATVRAIQSDAEAQVRGRMDALKKNMTGKLTSIGDDAQLANVDLQNALQKQQQTLQMMSNISKMMHDSATAIIRKIGG